MEQYILSFDPGKSTGIALGKITDTEPYSLVKAWQFEGGLQSLVNWIHDHFEGHRPDVPGLFHLHGDEFENCRSFNTHIISEKFQPISHENYALTRDSVEPLRCEGALVAMNVMLDFPHPTWRQPKEMYLYGGNSLAEKKKNAHAFLKNSGMHVTGKEFGLKDANDARSAILHGISYAARVLAHRPTFEAIRAQS